MVPAGGAGSALPGRPWWPVNPVRNLGCEIGGPPEQAVSDGHGKLYVIIQDTASVTVVDTKTMKAIGHFPFRDKGGCNGLALDDSRVLYVADSETSAVRAIALSGPQKVTTLVGTGLFDFGDVDGVGEEVLLQHVQAVCFVDGLLYLADTYNNRIKVLNPQTREVRSFAGTGVAGLQDGAPDEAEFNEPAGLAAAGGKLYVADTNNSALRVIDLDSGNVETLNVRM